MVDYSNFRPTLGDPFPNDLSFHLSVDTIRLKDFYGTPCRVGLGVLDTSNSIVKILIQYSMLIGILFL